MKPPPVNLPASTHRRLLNGAHERGEDPQLILQRYAAERFLYRLGEGPHREHFVLKGASLFALWGSSFYRPTRDLDFNRYGSNETNTVLDCFRDICTQAVEDDGMVFDAETLKADPIREETEYGGLRVLFAARLGKAEVRMQVDLGFGNAIEPPATEADYPTLLDAPAPRIRTYPQEAVVAEKLHAMVTLGERNSRYKDFYDLYVLARHFLFTGERLSRAINATFARRKTLIDSPFPAALVPRFFTETSRAGQWQTYLRKADLPGAPADFTATGEMLQEFLGPPWRALAEGVRFTGIWSPQGPWAAQDE